MRTHGIVGLVVACALSASANASECAVTVGTETIELPHVFAVAKANMFDDAKKDWVDVYCFRDEVPAEKQSASEIEGSWSWARSDNGRPDNPRIVITVSAEGDVRVVEVVTDEVEGTIFDARSYAEFDGAREPGGKLRGSIKTTKDMAMNNLGVENVPWRVSATLDVEVMSE